MRLPWVACALALGIVMVSQGKAASTPNAQDQSLGSIEGQVLTRHGVRVAGAKIRLRTPGGDDEHLAYSDPEGRFLFLGLQPGTFRLRVESEGFATTERLVQVHAGTPTRLTLAMEILPAIEKVIVTATRSEQRLVDIPAHVSVLSREDLQQSAALTVDDALRQIPSFSLFRRASSLVAHPTTDGVSLRGIGASGASRTLVLLDGVPLNDAFGSWVYWSKIPKSEIEKIEVVEGGVSNLYGSSAMAGVINITTRKPERSEFSLDGQAGMRGTGELDLFKSRKVGPFAMGVGADLFRTGGYRLVPESARGPVDVNADSRHETLTWRLDYNPNPHTTLFHNGSFFDEGRDNGTPLQNNSTRETYLGGGLRALTPRGSDWQANIFSHIQTFKSSFSRVALDRSSETLALLQEVPSTDVGANAVWARPLSGGHQFSAGADMRWIKANDAENVFLPTGVNVRDRFIEGRQLYAGFFFQDFFTPRPRLVLAWGGRVDVWRNYGGSRAEILKANQTTTRTDFPNTSETSVSPRAGVLCRLTGSFSVRGAFYQGFRAPTLNELYRPFRVGNVQTNENPNLGPERLTGGEVGFNYMVGKTIFWRATSFYNWVKDPISNVTLSATQGLIVRQRENLGRLRMRGIESEIEYQVSPRWMFRGSYLFDEATVREFSAQREIKGRFIPQVPRHRASLKLDHFNPVLFNASLQVRFESLRFDDDLNQLRLGSFWVADFVGSRRLREFAEVFVGIQNVFDRNYAVQASPLALLGLPLTVTAGIRFNIFRR